MYLLTKEKDQVFTQNVKHQIQKSLDITKRNIKDKADKWKV
jgi:hypothetical protein